MLGFAGLRIAMVVMPIPGLTVKVVAMTVVMVLAILAANGIFEDVLEWLFLRGIDVNNDFI